jgi:hypothetical protein
MYAELILISIWYLHRLVMCVVFGNLMGMFVQIKVWKGQLLMLCDTTLPKTLLIYLSLGFKIYVFVH